MPLSYRPEIDGLRAIAVLGVVVYHAEFVLFGHTLLSGGFLGVDIFFVISGYLITSIILGKMKEGTFSFAHFYERRTRRLLPALFTVMAVSLPFAWFYMAQHQMIEYAGSALFALFFSSNFWFWTQGSYMAEPSALKPLLHTWTLAVEEQFYIVFPLLLFVLWKWVRAKILLVFGGLFILSLAIAHWGSASFPDATFYLLPTRGWELLAGALMAQGELAHGGRKAPSFLSSSLAQKMLPPLGLLLVLGSFVLFHDEVRHPSLLTLIPVGGTMLLIWFTQRGEGIWRVLSTKIFVGIGLLSYSLYLWHWPILAFGRLREGLDLTDIDVFVEITREGLGDAHTLSNTQALMCVALAFLFSLLTYTYIEHPARNAKSIATKPFLMSTGACLILLGGAFGFLYGTQGIYVRFKSEILFAQEHMQGRLVPKNPCTLTDIHNNILCHVPVRGSKKSLLLIGDSMATGIRDAALEYATKKRRAFSIASFNGCPFFLGITVLHKNKSMCGKDERRSRTLEAWIKENTSTKEHRLILFLARALYLGESKDKHHTILPSNPHDTRSLESIMRHNLEIWAQNSDALVLIYPSQDREEDTLQYLSIQMRKNNTKDFRRFDVPISLSQWRERVKKTYSVLDSIQGDNIIRVYPEDIFCKQGVCSLFDEEGIFYEDSIHPSPYGSQRIMDKVEEAVQEWQRKQK